MSVIRYEVVDLSPLQFKDKVVDALGNPEKAPLIITATVVLDELAKRRGDVAESESFHLQIHQINTAPFYVHVEDQYGRWMTIDIPDHNTATISFEVITNE